MTLKQRLANLFYKTAVRLGISIRIDDSPGWEPYGRTRHPHDRDAAEQRQLYDDSLAAWRKNPLAKRIVAITTDYIIGEGITVSSDIPHLQTFIIEFWNHPKNRISNRLETLSNELVRAGDIFPLLFRNKHDGMSYIRFLTKDQVDSIKTLTNDWETETIINQTDIEKPNGIKPWYTTAHKRAKRAPAIALHYAINRPLGAQFGESDLSSITPWLLRYSRMLEDRVRLHWAARAFLWFVTVPTKTIKAKQEQYSAPPEPGSVVVKDDGEEWEVKTPNMRGADAANDMKAVRGMIDAGSGFPPHWRGEASDINLATAQAMQEPTERNLVRRQNHFIYMLHDIIWHAYQRAHEHSPSRWPAVPQGDYEKMFTTTKPDIAKTDNPLLAQAARELSTAASSLSFMYSGNTYKTKILQTVFKFLNEPLDEETTQQIITESQDADTTVNDNLATAVSAIKVGANGHSR